MPDTLEIYQRIAVTMTNRPWGELPLELRDALHKADERIRRTPDKWMKTGGHLQSRQVVASIIAIYESRTGIFLD